MIRRKINFNQYSKLTLLAIATVLLGVFASVSPSPAYAAPDDDDAVTGYVSQHNQRFASSKHGFESNDTLSVDALGVDDSEVQRYPLRYWRAWANQKLPWGRVLFFLMCVLSAIQLVAGNGLRSARNLYETRWLPMFGIGILFAVIGCITAGALTRLSLFTPAGTIVLGLVQIAHLIGLTIAAQSTGSAVLRLLKQEHKITKPWLRIFLSLWIGTVLLSLLILIPGFGKIPRLGNRMLALIASAGAGAVLMQLRRGMPTKEPSQS